MELYLEDELADAAIEYAKVKREAEKTRDPKLKKRPKELFRKIQVLCKKLGYWN
jgi:hypothetical protein